MRILIVSPPRSGNHWIKCLLSAIYELTRMGKPNAARAWEEVGAFPDGGGRPAHHRVRAAGDQEDHSGSV